MKPLFTGEYCPNDCDRPREYRRQPQSHGPLYDILEYHPVDPKARGILDSLNILTQCPICPGCAVTVIDRARKVIGCTPWGGGTVPITWHNAT